MSKFKSVAKMLRMPIASFVFGYLAGHAFNVIYPKHPVIAKCMAAGIFAIMLGVGLFFFIRLQIAKHKLKKFEKESKEENNVL